MSARGVEVGLGHFLSESVLELEDVYRGWKSWSDLSEDAGVHVRARGRAEVPLRRAIGRLLHVDDTVRLGFWRELLLQPQPAVVHWSERERRLLRMLVTPVVGAQVSKGTTIEDALTMLREHPQVCAELLELFEVLSSRVEHLTSQITGFPDVPLQVHAQYTRVEILAGFGIRPEDGAKMISWQAGVWWAAGARADLCAFTLDKSGAGFSPTTRYRDYAISRELIHWESQNVTRADSETGRRYQRHAEQGSSVMLFARLRQSENAYWCLGPGRYVSHDGERPMAIVWGLERPLPGDLFAEFAAAVA